MEPKPEDQEEQDGLPLDLPIGKRPPSANKSQVSPRDPRFDARCSGSNDVRHFIRNYSFVDDIRRDEIRSLEQACRKETNEDKRAQIKKTISRMKNKVRALEDKSKKLEVVRELKREKKSVVKKALIVDKFKELKQTGKLNKYLERKRKRLIRKDATM